MSRISLRHLLTGAARRPVAPRTTLHLQRLEERRNPVSGITAVFNLTTQVLEITGVTPPGGGFNPNDQIWVLRSGSQIGVFDARMGQFVPVQNTTTGTVNTGVLLGISVNGNGGNDLIDLNSANK